ncbi:MAG TPA: glycosidase [Candidatus Atribacteria bacterium]|nr:glycosidase [Candidatus Atribacteria bacterium]
MSKEELCNFLYREKESSLFRRYEKNPILQPEDWPYEVNSTFNPGACIFQDKVLLLVRVEDCRGFSHLTIATSDNGKDDWVIEKEPCLFPEAYVHEEQWGIEDPRIVFLEEEKQYAVTYVSFSKGGPVVSLALTDDFKHFEKKGELLPPEDKDASLFPRKFKVGSSSPRYALIHRPIIRGEAHIWISFSPDLRHWGDHQILIPTRGGWWDQRRVGLGAQPIETPEGWLIFYHGVRDTTSGSLYRMGAALLDLEDPTKVIYRTSNWLLSPKESFEWLGDVPGVVFPSGAIVNKEKNEILLYYGAADKYVGLAIGNYQEVLEYLKDSPVQ